MADSASPTPTDPSTQAPPSRVDLVVDGRSVSVDDTGGTLLDTLREDLGITSVKDGCAPQGQCGCCTVLVDGLPRVSCVTPLRRVSGRQITTVDGLDDAHEWAAAFCSTGASQCGFCTPGIIVRLAGLAAKKPDASAADVEQALLAHVCRCTGWRTIVDAFDQRGATPVAGRDLAAASERATLEGHTAQRVDPDVALGRADFADDTAPDDAAVALLDGEGRWVVGSSMRDARRLVAAVQGRRTTTPAAAPIAPPPPPPEGWAVTLQTSWVDPGYLETDASWARPGADASDPLANGGAFGAKVSSPVRDAAVTLADQTGRPVRVRLRREDTVRLGPKRPPLAGGLRADGSGVIRVARTPGIVEAIASVAPAVEVVEVDVAGPPTSADVRGAGWAEAVALVSAAHGELGPVRQPGGGEATCGIDPDGTVRVSVWPGRALDEVVLRSYCIGAVHQALSLVTSESLVVDESGEVQDLTMRSFGILRAVDMPPVVVDIHEDDGEPVAVSDAVFAATLAAAWVHQGTPPRWPTGQPVRS